MNGKSCIDENLIRTIRGRKTGNDRCRGQVLIISTQDM